MAVSENFKAAGFMALAMSTFTINDVIVKTVLNDINVGQAMFIRGLMVMLILMAAMRVRKTQFQFAQAKSRPLAIRALCEAIATVLFLGALTNLPIANASAILQALPLAVTLGAMLFFKEPVGWRRISAIIVGFIGVMIIIRPGAEGFNVYSVLVVISVFLATGRDLATRKLDKNIATLFASAVTAVTVTIFGIFLMIPLGGWQPVDAKIILSLAGASIFLFGGYQCLIIAMRTGEIGTIAPFRYTSLLWAVLLGYLVFGNLPDFWTIIGSIIVVGSGLYALLREHQRNRALIASKRTTGMTPPARGL